MTAVDDHPVDAHIEHLRSMDSTEPRSIAVAARALIALPLEIAHQILGYVPVYRILQMAISLDGHADGTIFERYLYSQPRNEGVFATKGHIICIMELYRMFYELSKCLGRPIYLQGSPLARNLQVPPAYNGKGQELMFANMRRYLVDEAWVMMNVLSTSDRVKMDEYLAGRLHWDWHLKPEMTAP